MQAMVLSVTGLDKPGLVGELAEAIRSVNGNWLRGSFCQLSGHFAGFVEITLPAEQHSVLVNKCKAISSLQITLLPAKPENNSPGNNTKKIQLKVTGNDRQGIVDDLSTSLHKCNLNIVELATTCESAPNWGNMLFTANISVETPREFESSQLKEAIESIADDLMVDLRDI